jgi:hypothetical protein
VSDLQELIHSTCMQAYQKGIATENERIIKVLEVEERRWFEEFNNPQASYLLGELIAQLKGENK